MGRYGDIAFLKGNDVPTEEVLLRSKMSGIGHGIAGVLLLGWSIGFPYFLFANGLVHFSSSLFDILFSLFIVTFCGLAVLISFLAGLMFLSSALAAARPSNWTLVATEQGLYVNLRSYTDWRLPADDAVIAFIPKREIRRFRFVHRKNRVIGDKDNPTDTALTKDAYLEIHLHGQDLTAIDDCLTAERRKSVPTWIKGVTAKAKGAAIQIGDNNGVLRIDWSTRKTRLTPKLDKTEALLSGLYQTTAHQEPDEAPIDSLSPEDQEARLLDMVHRGDKIDATILARSLYGLSLTEANRFLDDLQA
ncbi:MAG: hypothetical protein NXI13_02300 [Proteobacteria bacterium]|nr:hypothetical protein [Pseudomonadota bacterium]